MSPYSQFASGSKCVLTDNMAEILGVSLQIIYMRLLVSPYR